MSMLLCVLYGAFVVSAFSTTAYLLLATLFNPITHSRDTAQKVSPVIDWYPPLSSPLDNLSEVLEGDGIFGFIFDDTDSSKANKSKPYLGWNWCNMPHVHADSYRVPSRKSQLRYVEVVRQSLRSFKT